MGDPNGYQAVTVAGDIWLAQFDIDPANGSMHARSLAIIAVISWVLSFFPIWAQWYRASHSCIPRCLAGAGWEARLYSRFCQPMASRCRVSLGSGAVKEEATAGDTDTKGFEGEPAGEVAWNGLTVRLPSGRTVFEGLAGRAPPGRPLAILGPSGCGKTSLLGRLTGEAVGVVEVGSVTIGGAALPASSLSRVVGYVRQDDALRAELTVREVLTFAAALRLPCMARRERAARVEQVLRRLGLEAVADSQLGGEKRRGVSGGERRRAAVGVELVAARSVLVLDEPTSGLDSAGALALGGLLAELAAEGRVVICTLHQPRPELLEHFADALVLAPGGKVAYFGTMSDLPAYVDAVCGPAPPGGSSSASDRLLDAVTTGMVAEGFSAAHFVAPGTGVAGTELEVTAGEPTKPQASWSYRMARPPVMVQLWQLMLREMRLSVRDRSLAPYHYLSALVAGLLLGWTYWSLPLDITGVISRLGLFFAVECILGMQALQGLMAWREGHTGFIRERAAGYYSTFSYVLAKVVVDGLLLRTGPPLVLGLVLYQMVGLQAGREGICLLAFCLTSLASSTICLALGAIAPRSGVLLPVAVLLLQIFLLFGGVLMNKAPGGLSDISYFRASYQMMVANEFEGLSFRFNPKSIATELSSLTGEEWMRLLNVSSVGCGVHICVLLAWAVAYALVAWAALALGNGRLRRACRGCLRACRSSG